MKKEIIIFGSLMKISLKEVYIALIFVVHQCAIVDINYHPGFSVVLLYSCTNDYKNIEINTS